MHRTTVNLAALLLLIAASFHTLHAAPPQDMPGASVSRLRVEGLADPLGIDVRLPRFSWQMDSGRRGDRQTAYQIVVASGNDLLAKDRGDVWSSGKVNSGQSSFLEYAGRELKSGATYFWKVRIWNKEGRPSAWSPPARWSMGMLDSADWEAKWIGHDGDVGTENSDAEGHPLPARMLRHEFNIKKPVKRAYAYVCGLGLFEMQVNGRRVGDHVLSPAAAQYDRKAFYVTHDVTLELKQGKNAIGVLLGNGRYFAMRKSNPVTMVSFGYPKLLLQVRIEYRDGTSSVIASDGEWKWTSDGPIRENNEYDGEMYDARQEMAGWAAPGFDDSRWKKVDLVAPGAPRIVAQMNEPIRVTDHIRPVGVTQLHPGVHVVDMGQNMVGWARLTVQGPRGTKVQMRFAETLQPNGELYVANLRSARQTDTYTLKGEGTEVYEPRFTYHGFRFIEITGYPGIPDLNTILGCVVHDDVESTGTFATSNPVLNAIFRNTSWGILGNYRSMPTDCPQRDERHGWLGDRALESGGESYLFDVSKLYAKWLEDIRDAQLGTGSLPDLAPAYWPTYNDNVTWAGTYLIIPHMLYRQFGDTRIVERHHPAMKLWLQHMDAYMADGIMPRDTYGDWCVPPELPHLIQTEDPARQTAGPFIGSAYYCYILRLMSEYATLLGKSDEAVRFTLRADSLRTNLNRKFYDPVKKLYVNGTVTSSLLGLAFNLVPDADREALASNMAARIMTSDSGHVSTGLIGCQWLCRTLADGGRPDIVYTLLTQKTYPSLGYMIEKGATTIWELWNGDTGDPGMNSGNHVMLTGDLAIWLFENLAGIRTDARTPAFSRIVMRPAPIRGLTFVDASYRSQHGVIISSWKIVDDGFAWSIKVPAGSSADVWIPGAAGSQVTEGGKEAGSAPGVKFLRSEKGCVVYEIQSGSYSFLSKGYAPPVPAPVVTRNDLTGRISMMSALEGAVIRYETDGCEPSDSSFRYTGSFLRLDSARIKAETVAADGSRSLVTSASFGQVTVQAPVVKVSAALVEEPAQSTVEITPVTSGSVLHYTVDGSDPTAASPAYERPILVETTTPVKAIAVVEGWKPSAISEGLVMFTRPRKDVRLNLPCSPKYPGKGDAALIDGVTGTTDYHDSAWQGYEGTDLDAVIDLGEEVTVSTASAGFLVSYGPWIFPPTDLEWAVSTDGIAFRTVANEKYAIDPEAHHASILRTLTAFPRTDARYVRLRAKNVGVCPAWHRGAGLPAWLFVDEIGAR